MIVRNKSEIVEFKGDNIKFDLDDISIKSSVTTNIEHRSEVKIYDEYGYLPIIAAPMDTVVSPENTKLFLDNKLHVCLPRGERYNGVTRVGSMVFTSYSLNDFIMKFLVENNKEMTEEWGNILIDMANGHMESLVKTVKQAKAKYPFMHLMVGNIANPETYRVLSDAGADYIRVSIGSGGACLTSVQTGVNYPLGSLISECYSISCTLDRPAKIVADGGMKQYSDIIKSLALGADYVMVGGLLNKAVESAGKDYLWKNIPISNNVAKFLFKRGIKTHKLYRGMSTKEVQKKWGNEVLKTSEGVTRKRKVEYTLAGWVENFESYLRTAMSYTNSKNLIEFAMSEKIRVSENSNKRFGK